MLFALNDIACQTSCDMLDDDDYCIHAFCTSCIDLKTKVEALKALRDDMNAKVAAHNDMSVSLEKENELLRTTYARYIEEQMDEQEGLRVVLVTASNSKMRFWLQDERVSVLSPLLNTSYTL